MKEIRIMEYYRNLSSLLSCSIIPIFHISDIPIFLKYDWRFRTMGYLENGFLSLTDIQLPSEKRLQKGPVALVECVQKIPCNPCVDSCNQGAITMGDSINNLPLIDFEKCNGCGLCVANCPGLAVFIVDMTFEEKRALVGLPYEFCPLPEKGETVILMNRAGEECGKGEIIKVRNTKAMDRTPIIFMAMSKDIAMDVRFFRRLQ
jgi:Fe-S-cluster-containing hydrogenase component 2